VNAARAGLVHVGMSSAHPIAITAGTDGTLYMSGLADDPIEVVTWPQATTGGERSAAWLNSIAGLEATGPSRRDAADALRERLVDGLKDPEALLRTLAANCTSIAANPESDDTDRATADWQAQAYLAAARILFAAKQVALHEAERHTAQREAAYKAGQS
jgi:hypothetical protein